ncbi:MAG: AAA family ATPase, partial [Anaerolineae bacterium]
MNKILKIHPPGDESGRSSANEAGQQTRVIAITSGMCGVGKTNITSNLGIALANRGARVCIFDANTSLANINSVMGLNPSYTIEHLLCGEKSIDDIIIDGPKGVKIVPAASDIAKCAQLDPEQRRRLIEALAKLEERFDYLLIDTAAGVSDTVLNFILSAQYVVLVISPEPTSLSDAF